MLDYSVHQVHMENTTHGRNRLPYRRLLPPDSARQRWWHYGGSTQSELQSYSCTPKCSLMQRGSHAARVRGAPTKRNASCAQAPLGNGASCHRARPGPKGHRPSPPLPAWLPSHLQTIPFKENGRIKGEGMGSAACLHCLASPSQEALSGHLPLLFHRHKVGSS